MAKYTGKDLAVKVDANTIPAGYVRSVTTSETGTTADATAAGETHVTELALTQRTEVTLELLDDTSPAALRDLLPINTEVELVIYPQGATSGKPTRTSSNFLVKSVAQGHTYNSMTPLSISGIANDGLADGTA